MNVEDIMSKDVVVEYVPGTVEAVLKTLAEHNISGIPILKKGTDQLVGVVTRTDIFKNAEEDQIAMVMSDDFYSVKKGDSLETAAQLFYEQGIHGLPVVGKNNSLLGLISTTDILKELIKGKHDDVAVDHISKLVVPVYIETPINLIMEIINITNINALPVLDDTLKVVGIVTDGDLLKLSQIKEGVAQSNMGIGDDEDQWTWEGIRDTVRMYHATSEVELPRVPVKEVMVTDVKTATKNTPVYELAQVMLKQKITNIPIVDSKNRLKGMVSDLQLMRCMFKR
jgi:CBS domain-containing protein